MGSISPKTRFPIVLGAGLIGSPGLFEGATVTTVKDVEALLDTFQAHGHTDVDVARIYGSGSAETLLAAADWKGRGLVVRDKLYPTKRRPMAHLGTAYTLEPADVRRGLLDCLKALSTPKLDLFILYAPDRQVPVEDTLREVNKLYEEGLFSRLGISNYMAWEVVQIMELCEKNAWVKPSLYQSLYNVLHRAIEPDLIPCLRAYNLPLHVGQPLCGGFLTSRYRRDMPESEHKPGSRFDPQTFHGRHHRHRYWNDTYFDVLDAIRETGRKYNLTEVQCALRWLSHHSLLRPECGDAILVCGSDPAQLEEDLLALEEAPLPEEVVQVLDEGYAKVKAIVGPYYH
uniref:Aflatoxin B1 aldehyde reductase member 3 n=1 Tax=Monascus pilosus TaxID=89488 RepID=R9UQ88_MONPI|nr:aflatoxin B1 aldehyde reductase member 3 [Monascus pilosus]